MNFKINKTQSNHLSYKLEDRRSGFDRTMRNTLDENPPGIDFVCEILSKNRLPNGSALDLEGQEPLQPDEISFNLGVGLSKVFRKDFPLGSTPLNELEVYNAILDIPTFVLLAVGTHDIGYLELAVKSLIKCAQENCCYERVALKLKLGAVLRAAARIYKETAQYCGYSRFKLYGKLLEDQINSHYKDYVGYA